MKLIEVKELNTVLIKQLFEVWDKSVRETHLFLSDSEIKNISRYIPQALSSIAHLIVAFNDENNPVAFMGIEDRKLEMLFVSPGYRGKGLGKQLIQYGIENYSIDELGVNEQNPQAKAFYEHMGFQVYNRSDTDEQGNPYPILYMRLFGL
ncbi:MAG: GNAT family N-acetyltransferase [Paenibacillaceae bacterium]|nr:GNAT family N-acetyltransferase [Paenibacillaceae bacterium]